jgi:hypothetical protein
MSAEHGEKTRIPTPSDPAQGEGVVLHLFIRWSRWRHWLRMANGNVQCREAVRGKHQGYATIKYCQSLLSGSHALVTFGWTAAVPA